MLFILFAAIIHTVCYGQDPETTLTVSVSQEEMVMPLGSSFTKEYELAGFDGPEWGEILFEVDQEKFGIPLLIDASDIGHRFYDREDGETGLSHHQTFTYAFVPLDTGRFVIPRARVEINGKRVETADQTVRVLPRAGAPLRPLQIRAEVKGLLKEREVFTLQVTIEGDCDEEEEFLLYAPEYSWWTPVDNHGRDAYMPVVYRKTKSAGKHRYEIRMKAERAGTYEQLPNLIVWSEKEKAYFLSNPLGTITIEENSRDPRQVVITPLVPDTIRQGVPFVMRYKLEGCFENLGPIAYEEAAPEGWDALHTPVYRYGDKYGYYSPDEERGARELYIIDVVELMTELCSGRAGSFTLPRLQVKVDRQDYYADPVPIEVLPYEPDGVRLGIQTTVQPLAILEEEIWFTNQVEGYSGDLLALEADLKAYEKRLEKDFRIIGRDMNINQRSVNYRFREDTPAERAVKSVSEYKWLLQPRKSGVFTLPAFGVQLHGVEYKGEELEIDVRKRQMADFAEITIDPVVICKEEVRMTIKMKEPFWIIKELTFPDWPFWEEVELKTNRDSQVNSTLARLVFRLVEPGVLEIPPIRVRTDLDEFYTDPVRVEVLPQDTLIPTRTDGLRRSDRKNGNG